MWFSSRTIDSLSSSLARSTASFEWIRLSHSSLGAAGYGFSKSPRANLARRTLATAVSTISISSLPDSMS